MSSEVVHESKFIEAHVDESIENADIPTEMDPPFDADTADNDRGLWEIASLIGAAATIAGLCVFLIKFNEKPLPSWAQGTTNSTQHSMLVTAVAKHVTIPALLDLFKTAIEIMLTYPLTKALTKLTWLWFSGTQNQKLADITVFHKAAKRSVKGAFNLIWILKGR
jgi:hypothetical protein